MRHDDAYERNKKAFKDDPTLDPPEPTMARSGAARPTS